MKKKLPLFLHLALVVSLCAGRANAADSSLVGWWKLDGDITDSSGNGHAGVIYGNPQWVAGKIGGALHLDGTDDHVVVDGSYVVPLYSATVWFRITGGTGQQDIFGAYDPVGARYGASLELGTDGRLRYLHRFPLGTSGGTSAYSVASYKDGAWYHAAIVKSPEAATLYVNGAPVGTVADKTHFDQTPLLLVWGVLRHDNLQRFVVGDIDDVRLYNRPLSAAEIRQVMLGGPRGLAATPSPAEGATDVPRDVVLGWTAGEFAATHDVYLGTAFADVNSASRTSGKNLVGQGQIGTTYSPAAPLAYGQTYYWRVDEVNQAPDHTIIKGEVWSFTIEPYTYPLVPVRATASSVQVGMGPEKTIDGSGLTGDLHGTEPTTMWLSGGTPPNWIQYQFDKVYQLYDLKVWNSNQVLESPVGFGAKQVTVEYSTDGTTWTAVASVPEFAKAPGTAGYAANTTVRLGGILAQYVKLTIDSSWGGGLVTGLSEAHFTHIPVLARAPEPADAATNVSVEATLGWRPGREAASHRIYFGTDLNAVTHRTAPAQTLTKHGYTPGALNYGTSYYWRVDEVNTVTYPGDVWSFTTREYAVVDDFEGYTDKDGAEVFSTWIDGYADQSSGSTIGYFAAANGTFGETAIVHGGKQSMPFEYNNVGAPYYSEGVRTFDTAQNWTANGADTLSLWFRGYPMAFVDRSNDAYSVSGGGADIGGTANQFRFVCKPLSGDGSITARVDSQTNTNAAARAGVMIRATLDAGSMHATLAVTPGSSITLLSRSGTGGATTTATMAGALKAPYWVRISRTGNSYKAEYSADGKTWTQAGTGLTLMMGTEVYVGLAVSSHHATQISVADFSSVATIGAAAGQWQVAAIGAAQRSNSPAALYLTVEDKAGKKKTMVHPHASATTLGAWTEWRIALSDLSTAGINVAAVKKLTLGVGDPTNPKVGAAGILYFDDIGYGHPVK